MVPKKKKTDELPAKISNCFMVTGKRELASIQISLLMEKHFGKRKFTKVYIDCSEANEDSIVEELICTDMFAPEKAVVVINPTADHKKTMLTCLSKVAELQSLVLIIQLTDDQKLDKRESLASFLNKQKAIFVCDLPIDQYGRVDRDRLSELTASVFAVACQYNVQLSRDALDAMVYLGGYNLAQITQDIIKLSYLYQGQSVSVQQVQEVIDDNVQTTPFKFIEHLESGNVNEAMKTLDILLNRDELNPVEITGILINKLRLVCHVYQYFDDGLIYDYAVLGAMANDIVNFNEDEESAKLITYNQYPVFLALQTCQKFTNEAILNLYDHAMQLQLNVMGVSKLSPHMHLIDFVLSYTKGKGVMNEKALL